MQQSLSFVARDVLNQVLLWKTCRGHYISLSIVLSLSCQSSAVARLQGISMPNYNIIAMMQGIQTTPQIAVQNCLHPSGIKCVQYVTHLDNKSKFSQLMFSHR
jgi:hypothetical protein